MKHIQFKEAYIKACQKTLDNYMSNNHVMGTRTCYICLLLATGKKGFPECKRCINWNFIGNKPEEGKKGLHTGAPCIHRKVRPATSSSLTRNHRAALIEYWIMVINRLKMVDAREFNPEYGMIGIKPAFKFVRQIDEAVYKKYNELKPKTNNDKNPGN